MIEIGIGVVAWLLLGVAVFFVMDNLLPEDERGSIIEWLNSAPSPFWAVVFIAL